MSSVAYAEDPPTGGGIRIRNGFSANAGFYKGTETIGATETDFSATLYGIDWRIGLKISPSLALYLDSHLSFGSVSAGSQDGLTGNFASAVIGEYTLPQRIFIGAGAGFGVLNNPSGPLVQVRAGWYPLAKSFDGPPIRRLNFAIDLRMYFADQNGARYDVTQVSLSVGYDRF
jgi:hypothetical protein